MIPDSEGLLLNYSDQGRASRAVGQASSYEDAPTFQVRFNRPAEQVRW